MGSSRRAPLDRTEGRADLTPSRPGAALEPPISAVVPVESCDVAAAGASPDLRLAFRERNGGDAPGLSKLPRPGGIALCNGRGGHGSTSMSSFRRAETSGQHRRVEISATADSTE